MYWIVHVESSLAVSLVHTHSLTYVKIIPACDGIKQPRDLLCYYYSMNIFMFIEL